MTDTDIHSCGYYCDRHACIVAQRNELRDKMFSEKPEPKPVAWMNPNEESDGYAFSFKQQGVFTVPLYAAPPKKEWQGLTDEEIENCFEMSMFGTCRAIEAKLKEKNND